MELYLLIGFDHIQLIYSQYVNAQINFNIINHVKRKFKWTEVLEKIDPEEKIHTGDYFEILRTWKRELKKAKKIIKNVERGEFPGNYL